MWPNPDSLPAFVFAGPVDAEHCSPDRLSFAFSCWQVHREGGHAWGWLPSSALAGTRS